MRLSLALAALLAAAPAWAGTFATCVLEKMPGVENNIAAQAVYQLCMSENPGGIQAVGQGSGRGWFTYASGVDCLAKKAAATRSPDAAMFIGVACRRLYDKPVKLVPFKGKLDGEN